MRARLVVFAAALAAMVLYSGLRLGFGTDITNFLPRDSDAPLAAISRQLASSELTRAMVLAVGAEDTATAVAAARALEEELAEHPQVAWIRGGIDADQIEHVYRVYFPRRAYFLSEHPRSELPELLGEEALREQARRVRAELALPAAPLLKRLVKEDPLGAFRRVMDRFREDQPAMRVEQGHFVSPDGRFALLFLGTQASSFDSGAQAPFLADVDAAFARVAEGFGGTVTLEQAGANRFALAAEAGIRRDTTVIGAVSFVGITLLFLLFFRTPRFFALAMVPAVAGIVTATATGLAVFGSLDGLTLAFGTSLIGVTLDYSIHVLNHHALASPPEPATRTVAALRPTLALGAGTTMASFAGLCLTTATGFLEMGFFAVVGVGAALATTLWVLPAMVGPARPVPRASVAVAAALERFVRALEPHRRVLAAVPVAVLVLAAVAIPRVAWVDDLSRLWNIPDSLFAEEARVRERVATIEAGRFVIALAPDTEGALELAGQVEERLAPLVESGAMEGMRSIRAFLWPEELQRRNVAALAAVGDLDARIDAAFTAEGFRAGAFEGSAETLVDPELPPLTRAELEASPLGDLVRSMLLDMGDGVAAITYLRGLRDPDAVEPALQGLAGVHYFEQRRFANELYADFRTTTVRQMLVGSALVVLVIAARYRRLRPTLAAFLPSAMVALLLVAIFALTGVEMHLLHLMALLMVMGMGVDYGIFLVDSAGHREGFGATMLSLLLSCGTTVFVFGTLTLSDHPALRAIGLTAGLGVLLSFLLAPVTLVLMEARPPSPRAGVGAAAALVLLAGGGCTALARSDLGRWVLPSVARCEGELVPVSALPDGDRMIRERVRVRGGDIDQRYELVVVKRDDELRIVAFTGLGGQAFRATQRGTELEIDDRMGAASPVPPRTLVSELHRVRFRGEPAEPGPCAFTSTWVRVEERELAHEDAGGAP